MAPQVGSTSYYLDHKSSDTMINLTIQHVNYLQDGTSHYLKGLVLLLCYIVIGAAFFVLRTPPLRK